MGLLKTLGERIQAHFQKDIWETRKHAMRLSPSMSTVAFFYLVDDAFQFVGRYLFFLRKERYHFTERVFEVIANKSRHEVPLIVFFLYGRYILKSVALTLCYDITLTFEVANNRCHRGVRWCWRRQQVDNGLDITSAQLPNTTHHLFFLN